LPLTPPFSDFVYGASFQSLFSAGLFPAVRFS